MEQEWTFFADLNPQISVIALPDRMVRELRPHLKLYMAGHPVYNSCKAALLLLRRSEPSAFDIPDRLGVLGGGGG